MGTVLEMTGIPHRPGLVVALALALALSGCGNDQGSGLSGLKLGTTANIALALLNRPGGQAQAVAAGATPDAATIAAGRALLQQAGQPILLVQDPSRGLAAFMAPLGVNGDVVTWATPDYLTIGLRDGIVISTRGFGADLMSASAPTAARIALGSGRHQRLYYYLDGADQTQALRYDCVLSSEGPEVITLLGKSHQTRKVAESCSGDHGSFVNHFWFEGQSHLRQSSQLRAPGVGNLQLERIID